MGTATKQQNKVPGLRFSGFDNDWAEYKLSELVDNVGGTALESYTSELGTHKFISIGNYSTTGVYIDNGQRVLFNEKTKTKLLDKDNLAMVLNDKTASGDIIGATILIDEDDCYVYNQRTERLICGDKFFPKYAWLYLNSPRFRKRIVKIAQGGTQIYVNFPSVKKELIRLPELTEQQKIAYFLGSVDAWLDNLRQHKTALETYKRGMMQKLFSQQIRFKDKNDKNFPGWEEKELSEVAKISMGQSPESSTYNSAGEGKYLVQGNADIVGRKTHPRVWTSNPTKLCSIGDVIMTVRAPVGYIAKSLHDACIGRGVCALRATDSGSTEFLYQFLLSYEDKWAKYSQGSTFTAVNSNDIKSLSLKVPVLEEQQKIADFLTSLDKSIESKQQQIAKAEEWKKGLMQKMFV